MTSTLLALMVLPAIYAWFEPHGGQMPVLEADKGMIE